MPSPGATMKIFFALVFASAGLAILSAHAADLKVLNGNGARAAVTELVEQFGHATGHKVSLQFEVNPGVKRRIAGARHSMSPCSIRRCSMPSSGRGASPPARAP